MCVRGFVKIKILTTREFFARIFDLCTVRLDGQRGRKSTRSAARGHRGHSQRLSPWFRTIQICPKDLLATLREAERAVDRRLGSVGRW